MVLGAVAVIFSGFVLAHSPWGGIALFVGGAGAISLPLLRDRRSGLVPIAWFLFLSLLAVGLAGFLLGFGVFDAPDLRSDAEATLHDAGTDDATVLVTGAVTNAGDAPAETALVTVTLYDEAGDEIRRDTVRLRNIGPNSEQLFYIRIDGSEDLSSFDSFDVEVTDDP